MIYKKKIKNIELWCSSSQDCWVLCLLRMQYYTVLSLGCLILPLQCTETCQKYPVTVIFYYIFHIKPQFLKTLFQSQFLFDFDEIFTNRASEARTYVIFCDYF